MLPGADHLTVPWPVASIPEEVRLSTRRQFRMLCGWKQIYGLSSNDQVPLEVPLMILLLLLWRDMHHACSFAASVAPRPKSKRRYSWHVDFTLHHTYCLGLFVPDACRTYSNDGQER